MFSPANGTDHADLPPVTDARIPLKQGLDHPAPARRRAVWRWLELALLSSGLILLAVYAAAPAPAPEPAPAPAPAPEAPKMPKTASPLPLVGLLGLFLTGASFGIRKFRR